MSSRRSRHQRPLRGENQTTGGTESQNNQRIRIMNEVPSSSSSSKTNKSHPTPHARTVLTFVQGGCRRSHTDGPSQSLANRNRRSVAHEGRAIRDEGDPRSPRSSLRGSRSLGVRRRTDARREQEETIGECPRSSIQTTYSQNLLAYQRRHLQGSVSRGSNLGYPLRPSSSSSSSSSGSDQLNPAVYFTFLNQDLQIHNESVREFEVTKLNDAPDKLPKSATSSVKKNSPPIRSTQSFSSMEKLINDQAVQSKNGRAAFTTQNKQRFSDPQELITTLSTVLENQTTHNVQELVPGENSSLEWVFGKNQDPECQSTTSLLTLPTLAGKDYTDSIKRLAGSMATQFIELTNPQTSISQRGTRVESDEYKVPLVKRCERVIDPIDIYKKDLIIDNPIDPLTAIEPHETADAPYVESVMVINQVCSEIDKIFKDIHMGFKESQIDVGAGDVTEEQEEVLQGSDEQLLLELRATLLPPKIDQGNSIANLSVQAENSSRWRAIGQSRSNHSSASLHQDEGTEHLIEILNQKYEKDIVNPQRKTSSNSSGNTIRILYSSEKGRLQSKNTFETVTDLEGASLKSNQMSVLTGASGRKDSEYKSSLRRFTEKVQIPTLPSCIFIDGERGGNGSKDSQISKRQSPSHVAATSGISLLDTGTSALCKTKDDEKQAILDMIQREFGDMKLDEIKINGRINTAQSRQHDILEWQVEPATSDNENRDIFEGDPRLAVATGITNQLMLHKANLPKGAKSDNQVNSIHQYTKCRSKKTASSNQSSEGRQHNDYGVEDLEEQTDEDCVEWVQHNTLIESLEDAKATDESEREDIPDHEEAPEVVADPEEMRLLFPFGFKLSSSCSWWKRSRNQPDYRRPITKEKKPEFDELRNQLKAFLEEYQENYARFEAVYRWGDPRNPPVWNKKYRSPFARHKPSLQLDPSRFHLSDDALSMKGKRVKKDSPPGYSTVAFYAEPNKWWNFAGVRRYVIRKDLAKYQLSDRYKMRLGLRARPAKYSASLILGCKKRKSRKHGQVCRRNNDRNKTFMAAFMKRNLPKSMWKNLKSKYQVASSLRYRQRHHWNPFHPLNRPSIEGTRLGCNGSSLIQRNNMTFLGQFAKGLDEQPQPIIKAITDEEIRDKWLRDIMEIAYVAYCSNKLITEELQFLVMIGVWLGAVIDEYGYFMKFVMNDVGGERENKKLDKLFQTHIRSSLLSTTEKANPRIWEKIMKICDKTLVMLKRGLLPAKQVKDDQDQETITKGKKLENTLLIPAWYADTKLHKTNRKLLDSIALAYPDFYYLANKNNKYYHVELDADEARWFPIRYYDADTGEYNFISHDHPKWPDWRFLQMTSHGSDFQMSPATLAPYNQGSANEDKNGPVTSKYLDGDDPIREVRDSGYSRLLARARESKVPEKKMALVLMLMRECFDSEGTFRYLLYNPIKFDRKRINMSYKTLTKTSTQLCIDPDGFGLDDMKAKFLRKPKLGDKHIKLDPANLQRLLKKCAPVENESPKSVTDRRIDIALDYWYRKAAQVNELLESLSSEISTADKIQAYFDAQGEQVTLTFDDPHSLRFENEPIWNRRILENFQHGCAGKHDCDEDSQVISQSSRSGSCTDSEEDEEPRTTVDKLPSDFLKVMHTYFSLTTIETLRKENFVDFPVPLETMYCYEKISKGPLCKQNRVSNNRMSLGGRISERHSVRQEKRKELGKMKNRKTQRGDGGGDHARCMGPEDDPRMHVGFKSKCPLCHKVLLSHHPSLTLFIEFKTRHMNEHRMKLNAGGIKPPKKGGVIKLHQDCSKGGISNVGGGRNPGKNDVHDDCYLHCKTRLREETDAMDVLKFKQNYMRELHNHICKELCPIISQQIQALLSHQEMATRMKKRKILSSKYCKKRAGRPLRLLSDMNEEERMLLSNFAHQSHPYTLTTKKVAQQRKRLSRRILNDLYICWIDAYARGTHILSKLSPHQKNRLYSPDYFSNNFLETVRRILHRLDDRDVGKQPKTDEGLNSERQKFDGWFEEFVKKGMQPKSSSSENVLANEPKMSTEPVFDFREHSQQLREDDGNCETAASDRRQPHDGAMPARPSSDTERTSSDKSENSEGPLIDVSPSDIDDSDE